MKRVTPPWQMVPALLLLCGITSGATNASPPATRPIPAFLAAEGAGAYAVGGRYGSVYRVTNLNASGPGSLADAVSQPNRIIVFTVSGTIDLSGGRPGRHGTLVIDQPNLTIAGQSAPGEGICLINGSMDIKAGEVVVRYLRSRRGFIRESDTGDAFTVKPEKTEVNKAGEGMSPEHFEKVREKKAQRGKVMKAPARIENILLDHLSASWATDELISVTHAQNTTVQYCIAAEGLDYANPKQTPPNHSEGSLWGVSWPDGRSTMHHMLYAHNRLRNPRTTGGAMPPPVLEFANSIVYDCSEYTSHTGSEAVYLNWLDNYYKPGPSTPPELRPVMFTFAHSPLSRMFAAGNWIEGSSAGNEDNWNAVRFEKGITADEAKLMRADHAFDAPGLRRESARDAYASVLADAGATLPARDSVDLRIVNDVRNGTGHVINKETDLPPENRWPTYHTLPAPADTDGDGIPDCWEDQFGLNKADPSDAMKIAAGGYANIEHYLNNTDPTGGAEPIVYVCASVSRANARLSHSGKFRLIRTGDDSARVEIAYELEGTAVAGTHYQPLTGTVAIPAHERSAEIPVVALGYGNGATEETVVLRLKAGSANYHIGCPSASMVVLDP